MKKLLIILTLFSVMLCGCTQAENKPVSPTPSTNVPTTTETPTEPILEDEDEEPIVRKETSCSLCDRQATCTEIIKKNYNLDLGMYIEKAYYICDSCYGKVMENEKECNDYDSVVSAINISLANEECVKSVKEKGNGSVKIDKNGVSFENIGDPIIKELKEILGEDFETKITTSKEAVIEITDWLGVVRKTEVPNILESLAK